MIGKFIVLILNTYIECGKILHPSDLLNLLKNQQDINDKNRLQESSLVIYTILPKNTIKNTEE
jgi:hypothetical protein